MRRDRLLAALDTLYARYHHRRFAHPDPVEFLYRYPDPRDREVAGLVAAGLAYGRVASILSSVERVLAPMGKHPAAFVRGATDAELSAATRGFRHRWTTGDEVCELWRAVRGVLRQHDTLASAFRKGLVPGAGDCWPALDGWMRLLGGHGLSRGNSLVAWPDRAGACKRLHLYLRWMVRSDEVDPGGWEGVSRGLLLVPVDVHMHRIARALGLTRRGQANRRTVDEITAGFRRIAPEDPVRYDFALTRLPIRDRLTPSAVAAAIRAVAREKPPGSAPLA